MVRIARLGRRQWMWSVDDLADRHGHWQGTASSKELADFAADMLLTALSGEMVDTAQAG